MSAGQVERRPPQRSVRAEAAILEATRELLIEVGVHGLTVEGVAARAGVAKTTVYRRWRSKEELALAVLLEMVNEIVAVPDLGYVRDELVALVNVAVRILGKTLMGRVMQGLVSDLTANEELGKAFREQVVSLRLAEVRRLIQRGIARGELRPDVDAVLVHELLFGPVYYRLLLSGGKLDGRLAERIVDAVVPGIAAQGKPVAPRVRAPRASP
jgi:AcrR family transcriptional regulator